MLLPENTPVTEIAIKDPRWHDKVVLIAKRKVGLHNVINFTAKSLPDPMYASYETITKYPLGSNGKIPCYEVPLDELVVFEGWKLA